MQSILHSLTVPVPFSLLSGLRCAILHALGDVRREANRWARRFVQGIAFCLLCSIPALHGADTVAAPVFTPGGGTYTSPQAVTMTTATSGATIRYTTDGSNPTIATGTLYTGPVNISSTATLKAKGFKSGWFNSTVTSGTYTINGGTVPSITTTTLANAILATGYSQTLAATSGDPPLTWSLASGSLPAGLSVSSSGVISGTPAMDAAGSTTFTVRVTDNDGDQDTKQLTIATKAGIAGVRRSTGTFFLLGSSGGSVNAASNFNAFQTAMQRTPANSDPIRFLSLALSKKQVNAGGDQGFLGVAKINATSIVNQFSGMPTVTLCVILPLWTVPGDVVTLAAKTARANEILAGQHDADFINGIFAKFNNAGMASRVIFRLGHEAEVGYPWHKLDMNENLWRNTWDYVAALGKSVNSAFRFDYQGNGPFFKIIGGGDARDQWEFACPTNPEIFGCDLYIGNKTATQVLADIIELQAIAESKGVPFSIPEMGAWTTASGRNTQNHTDTDVKNFVIDVINLLKTFPANGPGSCLYWNWFEGFLDNGLQGVANNGGSAPWPNPTPNWPLAWAEYKAQLGN